MIYRKKGKNKNFHIFDIDDEDEGLEFINNCDVLILITFRFLNDKRCSCDLKIAE
jgi:muconolactone delta-isomerase